MIRAQAEDVWSAFRDVGAVHRRLLPGRVSDTRIEGNVRTLTFPGGAVVRELIVDIDDTARRLAYAVIEGDRLPVAHHHASFQVFADGPDQSRLVWITDFLPDTIAVHVRPRIEVGAEEMKQAIESGTAR